MKKRFFQLWTDLHLGGGWVVTFPLDDDAFRLKSALTRGKSFPTTTGVVPLLAALGGPPVDLCLTADTTIPFVSSKAANVLTGFAGTDVQLVPARVGAIGGFYLANLLRSMLECLDEAESLRQAVATGKLPRPVIIADATGGASFFRCIDTTVVVTEDLRLALDGAGVTGASYLEVSAR